jgi:hypothetical protein
LLDFVLILLVQNYMPNKTFVVVVVVVGGDNADIAKS